MSSELTKAERDAIAPYTRERHRIVAMARVLRGRSPRTQAGQDPADLLEKDERLHGKPIKALNITLTPTGCEWAKTGGCTMCGEWAGSTGGDLVSREVYYSQLSKALNTYTEKNKEFAWIRIYQEGNYTNDKEVDSIAQRHILSTVSSLRGVKRVTVETMARNVILKNILPLRKSVRQDVELEIGVGFEALDPIVRNVCINKGESLEHYRRAARLLRDCGCKSLAYVLVKPAFLTEREGINQAAETVKAALDMGFDEVSVEPVSIHDWSLVSALWAHGLYKPPWLWSVIEVIKEVIKSRRNSSVSDLLDVRIGGYEYYPHPTELAHNYHGLSGNITCFKKAWELVREFNESHDARVFDALTCNCRDEWLRELEKDVPEEWMQIFQSALPVIGKRIMPILDRVNVETYEGKRQ